MKKSFLVATVLILSITSNAFATSTINGAVGGGTSTGGTDSNQPTIDLNALLWSSPSTSTGGTTTTTNTNTQTTTTNTNPGVDLNAILGTTGTNDTVLEKKDVVVTNNKFSQLLKSNVIMNVDITKDVNFSETFSVMVGGQEKMGRDVINSFDIKYTSPTGEELKLSADKDPVLKSWGKLYIQPKSASTGGDMVDNQVVEFNIKNWVKFVDWGILNNDTANSYIKYGVYTYVNSDGTPSNVTVANSDGTISVSTDIMKDKKTGVKENVMVIFLLLWLGIFFIKRRNTSIL